MSQVSFQLKPVQYVEPEPYVQWYSRDERGVTRTYAPLEVGFKVLNYDGLWQKDERDISVVWNFDNPTGPANALAHLASTWLLGDRDPNTAINPWAGHVYRQPGTYKPTATLMAVVGGEILTRNLDVPEVVVTSQDDQFPGTQTICYTQDGDWTGAPPGADLRQTDANFSIGDSQQIRGDANKRILLKRGQANEYTLDEDKKQFLFRDNTDILFGAFGPGSSNPRTAFSFDLFVDIGNIVVQFIDTYSPYDPTASNIWWTGDRFGVKNVDWFPLDPLPEPPYLLRGIFAERTLIDGCNFFGLDKIQIRGWLAVNDTRCEEYFDFGYLGGDLFICSTMSQPEGVDGAAMGSAVCTNRGKWCTTGCDELSGVPVANNVVHSNFRNGSIGRFVVFSKCQFRAGGGHSATGDIPQPSMRLDQGTNSPRNLEPLSASKLGACFGQCHLIGNFSSTLGNATSPYGLVVLDSCTLEMNFELEANFDLRYGNIDVKNCLWISRDGRAGIDATRIFFSGETAELYTEDGADHSFSQIRIFNNTIALVSDNGQNPNAPVTNFPVISPLQPEVQAWNNAFFRVNSTFETTDLIPLAAPTTEMDGTTFLPLTGTTFDTLEKDHYPAMDFNGDARTSANAIYGFKRRAA